ncbi:MAG: hypothetical protein P1U42_10340 [Phycisphaerales bacterium]|nr:hypothetical protein [Phycisphaerales bacterium]
MEHPTMNTIRSSIILALICGTANTQTVFAQSESTMSSPSDQSPGNKQQVEEALAILPRVGTTQVPVMPTRQAVSVAVQPGLTQGQDWLKVLHETLEEPIEPSTLAEGAYILKRLGNIVRGPDGFLIFVPDKDHREPGEGPVLLMPCRTLEQLETEWSGQEIIISGEIFSYHKRNQLLISAYSLAKADAMNQDDQTTNSESKQDPQQPTSIEDDPDVQDLLEELEFQFQPTDNNRRANHRELDSPIIQTAPRKQATLPDSSAGIEEGTLILRRPARLVRNNTGAWTVVFDNDNKDESDAIALIVEPCRMLMRMESIAMEDGDAGQLLVSGRVYTYKGSGYILPTLMQRIRPQGINTLQ